MADDQERSIKSEISCFSLHLSIQMRITLYSVCFKFGCIWYM